MKKKAWSAIFPALGMIMLILDSKTAISGGLEGVRITLLTILPALFPFFVLSTLLTASLTGLRLRSLRPIGAFCRMPIGAEPLLLLGLLGGYPSGAQAIRQAYSAGQITRQDARRLLGFCNNAGPSFLFGIAALVFPHSWMPWALWLIHIISAILTGHLLPGDSLQRVQLPQGEPITLPKAVDQAARIMVKVCSWIILFRIFLAFCDRWFLWYFPSELQTLFVGILELSNGCLQLQNIASIPLRFCMCSAFLSLGGISVAMQTLSVVGSLGLGDYLPGKLLQCAISILLSVLIFFPQYIPLAAIHLFFFLFLRKIKNNSRKSEKVIV